MLEHETHSSHSVGDLAEFCQITNDLLRSPQVESMAQWLHHGDVTCLDHSISVAVTAFSLAKKWGLDRVAVARAGLLHDLYLYHKRDKSAHSGWQCFDHPRIAAKNAEELTHLTEKERNIILSHMWPAGGQVPSSPEAVLVNLVDTLSAVGEFTKTAHPDRLRQQVYKELHTGSVKGKGIYL